MTEIVTLPSSGVWRAPNPKANPSTTSSASLTNASNPTSIQPITAITNPLGNNNINGSNNNSNSIVSITTNNVISSSNSTSSSSAASSSICSSSHSHNSSCGGSLSSSALANAAASAARIKRGHVSKACTNCRKMHAGCDKERPCSRCVFNGWENSCVDTPRKKRVSKKIKMQQTQIQQVQTTNSAPQPQVTYTEKPGSGSFFVFKNPGSSLLSPKEEMDTSVMPSSIVEKDSNGRFEKIWSENSIENELFSELHDSSSISSSASPSSDESLSFVPENLLITELSFEREQQPINNSKAVGLVSNSSLRSSSSSISTSLNVVAAPIKKPNSGAFSILDSSSTSAHLQLANSTGVSKPEPNTFVTKRELTVILREMAELREKNKSLESRLSMMTAELSETRERQQQMIQILSNILIPQNQVSLLSLMDNSNSNLE